MTGAVSDWNTPLPTLGAPGEYWSAPVIGHMRCDTSSVKSLEFEANCGMRSPFSNVMHTITFGSDGSGGLKCSLAAVSAVMAQADTTISSTINPLAADAPETAPSVLALKMPEKSQSATALA